MAAPAPAPSSLPSGETSPFTHLSPDTAIPSSITSAISERDAASPRTGSPAAGAGKAKDGASREPTTPAACLACREKHLKCDGKNPCTRCMTSSFQCLYVASRRGYKGPRRGTAQNPNKRRAASPPQTGPLDDGLPYCAPSGLASTIGDYANLEAAMSGPPSAATPSAMRISGADQSVTQLFRPYTIADGFGLPPSASLVRHHSSVPALPSAVSKPLDELCLDSFYSHFHGAHPFLLPKDFLLKISAGMDLSPLLAAMRWVGSLYINVEASQRSKLLDLARQSIADRDRPQDGFLVQALMVLMVGLDGNCYQDEVIGLLDTAERLALRIGLNARPFATVNGRGIPILEESWRRTWWDLYMIDGMIAGVHQATSFMLYDVPADVALPCEEDEYLSGSIPLPPLYLEDLEDREFSGEERPFSSFAYRVLCGRILGKLMRTSPPTTSTAAPPASAFPRDDDDSSGSLAHIDALLTNWRLHLPPSKRDCLTRDGQPDEMMFQAHFMLHATSLLLHRPRSQLDHAPARAITSCAPSSDTPDGGGSTPNGSGSGSGSTNGPALNAHTRHAIASATDISNLVTHRGPLLAHTHFFTCVLTLSSIVHLGRWALLLASCDDDHLRQLIRLNIGALNALASVWPAAARARDQVRLVARDIYRNKKHQQNNPYYWLNFSQDQMLSSIGIDDSIISEVESFQPTLDDIVLR